MRKPPALISNEYRTQSMSDPNIELEVTRKLHGGHDPLFVLIAIEARYGTAVGIEFMNDLDVDNPYDECPDELSEPSLDEGSDALHYEGVDKTLEW